MSEISIATEVQESGHTTRRLETRRKLLEAGTELFAEAGVRTVTTTAIARRAGVATGTFYLHFADKHALFEELVDAALEEMAPRSDPERDGISRVESVRRDLERMLEVAQRRRNLIRAVFDRGESSGLAERIQDRLASTLEERYARASSSSAACRSTRAPPPRPAPPCWCASSPGGRRTPRAPRVTRSSMS